MGLTAKSTGKSLLTLEPDLKALKETALVVALAGNPNTGKSTVFNSLTGLKQHTGNWPGKTVGLSVGKYIFQDHEFSLIDLPGTYSLFSDSVEEEIARDFICFNKPDVTVIVVDGSCLERNLHLVLQILEITTQVVICVNLLDEAKSKGIDINLSKLAKILGIKVVGTVARNGMGLEALKKAILLTATKKREPPVISTFSLLYDSNLEQMISEGIKLFAANDLNDHYKRWLALRFLDSDYTLANKLKQLQLANGNTNEILIYEQFCSKGFSGDIRENIVHTLYKTAETIAKSVTTHKAKPNLRINLDKIITSKALGIPIMLLFLGLVFWLTIIGANYPSQFLSNCFSALEDYLLFIFKALNSPAWLTGLLILGVYRTLAWVVSVMLPPMAIFFPLFTLLEDWGFLPRIAFNLDNFFRKAGAHGKQSLSMCMGFGCNAAGAVACRIIDSPRERLIAILTNNFVPCNGRFPTLLTLITLFVSGSGVRGSLSGSLVMVALVVSAIIITLATSKLLSMTLLRGLPSSFALELPPFRKPQIGRILMRSLLDRTLFLLSRAVVVAAPAGLIIWLLANFGLADKTFLEILTNFLAPLGRIIGLDGVILAGFILGLPANEIVLPIIFMAYTSSGSLIELESLTATKTLLINNNWTLLTALCTIIFSLNHFPCATTLLTIKKETQSWYWSVLAFVIPTVIGLITCSLVAFCYRLFFA